MFEDKTHKALMDQMIQNFTGQISTGEGSFVESVLSPAAVELVQSYMMMAQVLNEAFPQTASFEALKLKAEEYGLDLKTEETQDDLLKRLLLKMQKPSTSGNKNDYLNWALSVDGVGAAKVFPTSRGPGTVDVAVVGIDRRSMALEDIDLVKTYIESVRPVGANVDVVTGEEVMINVSAQVRLGQGHLIETVEETYRQALESYFKEIAFVSDQVSASQAVRILLDVPGVQECLMDRFTLNGSAQNVILGEREVPVVGTLALSVKV